MNFYSIIKYDFKKILYKFNKTHQRDIFVSEKENVHVINYSCLRTLLFPLVPGILKEFKWIQEENKEYIVLYMKIKYPKMIKFILTGDDENYIIHYKYELGKRYYSIYGKEKYEEMIKNNVNIIINKRIME